MAKKGNEFWIIVVLIVLGYLFYTGKIKLPSGTGMTTTPTGGGGYYGQLASLWIKSVDKYRGSADNLTAELWTIDNKQKVSDTIIASALTNMSSNLPNSFDGYVMIGKDNYVTTSRYAIGDNYYYVKYPVSWTNKQGIVSFDDIKTYAEETSTGSDLWTFYDDNTAESTANITVGSGEAYTASSVKLKSSSNNCTGNPNLNGYNGKKAVGFCFNESASTTTGKWKEVKPNINSGTFTIPGWLSGKNVISCYYTTDAKCDGEYFTTDLYFEAQAGVNPGLDTYTNETHTFTNNSAYTMSYKPILSIQRVGNTTTNWPSVLYSRTETTVTILFNGTYLNTSVTAASLNVSYITADYIHIIPVDLCRYKDDALKWTVGFGDESSLAADTDCGMDSSAQALKVWIA